MRVLWLNSGGTDAEYVIKKFTKENPDAMICSCCILTDFTLRTNAVRLVVENLECEHMEMEYTKTRNAIAGYNSNATQYWGLEYHFRGLQCALENDFDTVLSGATNKNLLRDKNDESYFETLMERIQDLFEVPTDKRVTFERPVKTIIDKEERIRIYEEEANKS